MGKVFYKEFRSWEEGIATSTRPDQISPAASPRAIDNRLLYVGNGIAVPGKRKGGTIMNVQTLGAIITGQFQFRKYSGGFSTYHLVTTSTGKLKVMDDASGGVSDADTTNTTPFTTGSVYPDFAAANNLAFIVNGVENKKYTGTTVQAIGIAAPAAAPTVTDSGNAGNPNGAYDFALTYYNSATGAESSLSGYNSVTVASKKITVSWTAPTDTQVDYVRVQIRKTSLNGNFFRLTSGTTIASDTTTGGFAVSTLSISVDVTDSQINALVSPAPSTTENNQPAVLDRIEFHQQRLFGVAISDPSTLVFSKAANDVSGSGGVESFDPSFSLPINPKDGDRITGLLSAFEMLFIFKKRAIYVLVGDYPTWELRLVTNNIGAVSHTSIVAYGTTAFFWSTYGPCSLSPGGEPNLIAQPNNSGLVDSTALNFLILDKIAVGLDETNMRIIWSIPSSTSSQNNYMMPYSLRLGRLESDHWELWDVASMATVLDGNEKPQLYMGDYGGRIFRYGDDDVDGIPYGTLTGTVTSATSSSITVSGATFYTAGSGLAQQYLYVIDAMGTKQRKRIGSNTATTIALDTSVTFDNTIDSTFTFIIGGPNWQFDCRWEDLGIAMYRKRFEYLYIDILPPVSTSTLYVDVFYDFSATAQKTITISVPTASSGALWDVAQWDVDTFVGSTNVYHARLRMGSTGRAVNLRLRQDTPGVPMALNKLAFRAESLTDKN